MKIIKILIKVIIGLIAFNLISYVFIVALSLLPEKMEKVEVTKEELIESAESSSASILEFNYISLDEWEWAKKVETKILYNTGLGYRVIKNPRDPNLFYFTSESVEYDFHVWEFNSQTDELNKIWTYSDKYKTFSVVGYLGFETEEDDRLVIFIQDSDDSPGPCFSPLLSENSSTRYFTVLKLNGVKQTQIDFETYTLPVEAVDIGQKKYDECVKMFFSNDVF